MVLAVLMVGSEWPWRETFPLPPKSSGDSTWTDGSKHQCSGALVHRCTNQGYEGLQHWYWILDTGYWMLDARCSSLSVFSILWNWNRGHERNGIARFQYPASSIRCGRQISTHIFR